MAVRVYVVVSVGDTCLEKAITLAQEYDTGIHIHVAEDLSDQDHCRKNYGRRVMQRLYDAGGLDLKGSIFGHCTHLDENEKTLLRDSNVWVAQNVESNLNNNVGVANFTDYGNRIMLGTDGMHSDMLRSAKASFYLGQEKEGISFPGIYERFRNIHRFIRENNFQGDTDNNLVILDYTAPTKMNQDNFLGHFVYGIDSSHVESVISSGRMIVQDKKLVSANEEEILSFAREMGSKLWEKLI